MAGSLTHPLMITIPHSGENIPPQAGWLKGLPEEVLMCDVDRFVDFLYEPSLKKLDIPAVTTQWHRYAADLNRIPEDVDASSVIGNQNPAGLHNRGFHWVVTTYNHNLLPQPMSMQTHQELVDLVYKPFHQQTQDLYAKVQSQFKSAFHIDAHSMPSLGTSMHRDPGELRADIVVSDCKGKSCDSFFTDLVIAAYSRAGFKVGYNWPYFGGRVSEVYGDPNKGRQAIQVELNRSLYMDEKTKKIVPEKAANVQKKIAVALEYIVANLKQKA
ncbi:MAG: N-formylglutamate amidohydrolase [Bdellovibrionia bacterium]